MSPLNTCTMRSITKLIRILLLMTGVLSVRATCQIPSGYAGRPFRDSLHSGGLQVIPGRLETAYYDLGGEGVAYHDADSSNNGSGVLNHDPLHQRPGVPMYICHFRGVHGNAHAEHPCIAIRRRTSAGQLPHAAECSW